MPRIRLIKSAHISALDPLHSPTMKLSAVHTAIIEIAVSELKAPLAIGKYGLLTLSSFFVVHLVDADDGNVHQYGGNHGLRRLSRCDEDRANL